MSISFRNADGQTCYSAVLARGSFQPSLGELLTEDAYSDWFGELTPQEQEAARAFADYAGRSAPDGYALFNRLWDVSRENVEMTYLPPDDFIVLAYFPDSGRVIASDICRTYVFNSYFTADLSRSDSLLYIKQSYNVGIWLLEFAARVLITIAVELVVALIFGYWEKKTLLFFAAVNLATQVLLNMILSLVNIRYGFLLFLFAYMFGELIVVTFEAVFYSAFIGKYSRQMARCGRFSTPSARIWRRSSPEWFSVNFTALM